MMKTKKPLSDPLRKPLREPMRRRQFLIGAGGAALALPFLPSLLSKSFAAEPVLAGPNRCFFAIGTGHGNVWSRNMYPDDVVLDAQATYAGRTVRHGALPSVPDATGNVALSPVCTAAATALTPTLVSKINILRGVDIPYRISHHSGGYLGNFAGTVGNITNGLDNTAHQGPTIDQVIGFSDSFYSIDDLQSRMTHRTIQIGNGELSWNYSAPVAKAGALVSQPALTRNIDLFNHVFNPGSALNGVDQFLVDRVKSSYDRLKRHPRLSQGDRVRLDGHIGRMAEIERKLAVVANQGTIPAPPGIDSNIYRDHHSFPHDPEENKLYCGLMNDMIVVAFSAGLVRVGTWGQRIHFADQLIQDWHGQVAHQGFGADVAQAWTVGWNQGTFEHVMIDLASKMDAVIQEDGTTLLDNSLIMFSQEAGQNTHHTACVNYPIVTAGGAGGYFNTGRFVDFTNQNVVYDDLALLADANPLVRRESPGLYYQQYLGNVLESMGVCAPEYGTFKDFESGETTYGFGLHHIDSHRANDYALAKAVMGDRLPIITS